MKHNVLFVCLGNICRSPAAEGVFKDLVEKKKLSHDIHIDSAGTCANHIGETADPRMQMAAKERGLSLTSRGRQFVAADFKKFDKIIVMDQSNFEDVLSLDHSGEYAHKVHKMTNFSSKKFSDFDNVPDPYYGGQEGFDLVLDLLQDSCQKLLDDLSNH